jgi:hypothetical protein
MEGFKELLGLQGIQGAIDVVQIQTYGYNI